MNNMKKLSLLCVMSLFAIAACREPGPAEQAGRNLDAAIEDLSDQAQETCEEIAGRQC
jgi:predicted small lipoprotein YifL